MRQYTELQLKNWLTKTFYRIDGNGGFETSWYWNESDARYA